MYVRYYIATAASPPKVVRRAKHPESLSHRLTGLTQSCAEHSIRRDSTQGGIWGSRALPLSIRRGRGARLVEARGKQVQRCEDAAVGAEVVLFHDVLIVHLQGTGVTYAKNSAEAPGSSVRACCCNRRQRTVSRMSMLASYGVSKTAGSKFMR